MGSSGSGRISDYPGSSSAGSGGGENGGGSEDRCAKAFNARLEDVEQSEYYVKHRVFPPIDTMLRVAKRKRLVAETTSGESIGNLPTSLNHIAACMKAGWNYIGKVQSVVSGPPTAAVAVDFAPTPPQ